MLVNRVYLSLGVTGVQLKFLLQQLAHYAYEYLHEKLGLGQVAKKDSDLNRVLRTCLEAEADK